MRLLRFLKNDLAAEIREWTQDGLLSRQQAEQILARYGQSFDDSHKTGLGYYVLVILAALFAGGALLLIVSHNWDDIPRATRMLSLIGLTAALNAAGIWYYSRGHTRAGVIWLFAGGIAYGASIMLIAQIYHLGEHFPDGILIWALGIAPMAALTRARPLAWMLFILTFLWLWVEQDAGFFPHWYPALAAIVLWLSLRYLHAMWLFLLTIGSLVWWANLYIAYQYRMDYWDWLIAEQVPLSVSFGLALIGLAWVLMRSGARLKDYGLLLHIWLLRGSAVLLFIFSFSDTWREFLREPLTLPWFMIVPLAAVFGLLLSWRSGYKAWFPLLVYSLFFSAAFALHGSNDIDIAVTLTLLTNLLLLFMGIWLIYRGVNEDITHYFYFGITVLLLTALLRYFDLIGDYIGGAVLFMIAAGILLAAARFWRHRQIRGVKGAQ